MLCKPNLFSVHLIGEQHLSGAVRDPVRIGEAGRGVVDLCLIIPTAQIVVAHPDTERMPVGEQSSLVRRVDQTDISVFHFDQLRLIAGIADVRDLRLRPTFSAVL